MSDGTDMAGKEQAGFDGQIVVRWLDKLLDFARTKLTSGFFDGSVRLLTRVGHIALLASAAIGLLMAIVVAVKADSFTRFVGGLGWVVLIVILQYSAGKFMASGEKLVRSTPSRMATSAFLDCFALINLIAGWAALIGFTVAAIRGETISPFWIGLCVFAVCEYLACAAMSPALLNISMVPQAEAGEEATNILAFLAKVWIRLVSVVFGVFAAVGTLGLVWLCIQVMKDDLLLVADIFHGTLASGLVVAAAAMPLVSFLVFVLSYLSIELVQAILSVPGKLDALKK